MATKDYSLPLKSKQNFVFDSNGHKNFNLKQKNSSNAFSESSKNVSSENRKVLNYDFANNNYSKTQKQSHSWNKATKNSSPTFGFIDGFKKESGGKISCSSSISNSTLSLHIAAYENSTVSGLHHDGTKKSSKQNGLIQGNPKQFFTDFESIIQNPFEFPRQQENVKAKTPKVAQYTASQRLLNPNQLVTPTPNQMNQINSQVDEEPDFSVFQEPPNVQSFVASPLPSTSASRVFNRLRCGSRINKRRSKQITDSDIPSLPNTQSTTDENFDDDNDGPDDVFDDFSPAPVITEKKEKSLTRWIFEEILAFIICLIYLAGFNVLLKTFL